MSGLPKSDPRIIGILDQLERFSSGDYGVSLNLSDKGDGFDAISARLNALGSRLQRREDHINKIRQSKEEIKTIFQNAPDGVIVINSRDVIIRWNPAASVIFGWKEEEVSGKFLHEILIPERYRQKHLAGLQRFLKTGQGKILQTTIEMPALCRNNAEIEVELTISAAKVNDDCLFVAFLRDITERKKAEAQIHQLNATLERRVLERTKQLNVSEAKYRHLFQNNPMALWVLDLSTLKFVDVNESALKLYGYDREEFLSMTSVELRPKEERERYLKLNRKLSGTQNTGIWQHCKKDGTIIHAEVIVHSIEFEGKPARFILANDVTDRVNALRELQISEARFRRIFESKMIGFLFWDDNGKITECNDLFLEMIGYNRSDVQRGSMRVDEITPPEYAEALSLALAQMKERGVCEPFEQEYIRRDGTRLPVMVGGADISDSSSVKGVTFVMDISQRKKMQQEILDLNRGLEIRIDQRTHALKEVNKELESFTYSVSHDLRAPLRAIHGYAQMLAEDYQDKLDQEGVRLIDSIKANAGRMGQLVDDLLAFSRMGKIALTETETDLTALVRDLVKDLSGKENSRAKIVVHPLGVARADTALLRQVFQNLISNALKYSSKKPRPEIEIGVREIGGERVWFVKDNGAGFDMAYQKKLFGVFERLHEPEDFEGTGVGLAIVRRIVHRHGGKTWGEGKVGEGAVFYFTLGKPRGKTTPLKRPVI